jgi:hypothetical protein
MFNLNLNVKSNFDKLLPFILYLVNYATLFYILFSLNNKNFLIFFILFFIPGFLTILILKKLKIFLFWGKNLTFSSILIYSILGWSLLLIVSFLKIVLPLVFFVFFCIFFALLIHKKITSNNKKININDINKSWKIESFTDCVVLLLFNISSYIILPLLSSLKVPPLHDGIANSYFGKVILENNFSMLPKSMGFYQPGGSILTAIFSLILKIDTAQTTHYLTIFSLVITPIIFSIFVSNFISAGAKNEGKLKKFNQILIVFVSFLIIFFINKWTFTQFFIGSKNSWLIGSAYYFSFLFFISSYIFTKNKVFFYPITLIFIAASIIHYTYFFLGIPLLLLCFFYLFNLSKNKKNFFFVIFIIIFFTILVITVLYLTIIPLKNLINSQLLNETYPFSINFLYQSLIKPSLNFYIPQLKFIIVLGFISSFFNILKKENNLFSKYFLIYLISFIIFSVTPLHVVKVFTIVYNFYLIPLLASTVFIETISDLRKMSFLLAVVIWVSILSSYELKYTISPQLIKIKQYTLISNKDIEAFDWISLNLSQNYLFFPLQYSYVGPEKKRIFDLSAIGYIKVFTDYNSCPEFIAHEEDPNCSDRIIPYLIKYRDDLTNPELITILQKNKIKYFYYSKHGQWGDGVINYNKILGSNLYKKIYDNGSVEILELK